MKGDTVITVNIHEAKANLSCLIAQVLQGESVVIARAGKPVVKVTALDAPSEPRRLGFMSGAIEVPDDFDRLDEAEVAAFFGAGV